jgi:two-component system, sensor histidine kinase and response regulator
LKAKKKPELYQNKIFKLESSNAKFDNTEFNVDEIKKVSHDLVYIFSKEGFFLENKFKNNGSIQGSSDKIVGKHLNDVFPRNIAEGMIAKINKTIETKRVQCFEYLLESKGQNNKYEAQFVLITEDEVLCIIRNIAEREIFQNLLLENELKFNTLTETIPCAILIYSGTNFIYTNPIAEELSGYSKRELLEMNFWDLIHPDFQEEIKNRGLARQKGQTVANRYEFPIIKKNGEVKWVDYTGKMINYQGKAIVIGIALDITDRIKTDEKIKKLSLAIEHSPASILITDTKGVIEYVNPKFVELTGYSYSEMVGANPGILKSGITSKEEYENLWATILSGKDWKGVLLNRKKNGEFYWGATSITCMKNNEGNIVNFLAIIEDITEQKNIEEKLIQSERNYKGLFENVNDPIIVFDIKSDKILTANNSACSLFEKSKEQLTNSCFNDLNFNSNQIKLFKSNLLKSRWIKNFEAAYYNKDNHKFEIELNASIINYYDSKAILVICRDITQKKLCEQQLIYAKESAENADRLKTDFLTQMSHEIRTPVNTILSYAWYLKDELEHSVSEDLRQAFKAIESGGQRLTRTIDLILDLSKVQSGNYEICTAPFDIVDSVLNSLYIEFLNQAKIKGIKLNLVVETDKVIIPFDYQSVVQIFSQLLDNAIKFTQMGEVKIRVYDNNSSDFLYVDVSDTGIGISEKFLSKMFSPFLQEEGGYTRSYEGNGLGLALVNKFVKMNNADIEVESEKYKGTTFRVIFKRNPVT